MKWKALATMLLILGSSDAAYASYQHLEKDPAVTQQVAVVKQDINTAKNQLKKYAQSPATSKPANQAHAAGANQVQTGTKGANVSASTANPAPQQQAPAPIKAPQPANAVPSAPILIRIAPQSQNPELYNGCEVTSLSMLLQAANHPVSKMELANELAKDPTLEVANADGGIASWGDPNRGFVGDVTGQNLGYGVYHGPITKLLNSILPGAAVDLTGSSFDQVLAQVSSGKPVVAWTTVNFSPTSSWVTWQGPNGPVRATFNEHVVLIVGFNDKQIFINDPLDGTADKAVDRSQFEASWQQLGEQAVSFK